MRQRLRSGLKPLCAAISRPTPAARSGSSAACGERRSSPARFPSPAGRLELRVHELPRAALAASREATSTPFFSAQAASAASGLDLIAAGVHRSAVALERQVNAEDDGKILRDVVNNGVLGAHRDQTVKAEGQRDAH